MHYHDFQFIEFKYMNYFVNLCSKKQTYTYDPQAWSYKLGQSCRKCKKNIGHDESISICECYLYCHKECFLDQFQHQLINQRTQIQCGKCFKPIKFYFDISYVFHPSLIRKHVLASIAYIFTIAVIVYLFLLVLQKQKQPSFIFFYSYVLGIFGMVVIYLFSVSIQRIFFKKITKLKSVKRTSLEIMTSAFKQLQNNNDEDLTNQQLILPKN